MSDLRQTRQQKCLFVGINLKVLMTKAFSMSPDGIDGMLAAATCGCQHTAGTFKSPLLLHTELEGC
jgi:hypothetical protein